MSRSDIEIKLQSLKPFLSDRFFVERIGLFGSYAQNEQTDNSDIDLLVDFRKSPGWDFFDLQDFLEAELNTKIDLVSVKALKEPLKAGILEQVRYV